MNMENAVFCHVGIGVRKGVVHYPTVRTSFTLVTCCAGR